MSRPRKAKNEIILAEAAALAEDLVTAGASEEKVVTAVAEFLDAILPMDALIAGPVGELAEAADGPALKRGVAAIVDMLQKLLAVSPEEREARRDRRSARRASRQAARHAKKEAK